MTKQRPFATREQIIEAIRDHLGDMHDFDPSIADMVADFCVAEHVLPVTLAKDSFKVHVIGNIYYYEKWQRRTWERNPS